MGDYTLTLEEVSKRLNKSKKTISRYIKNGLLHPEETLSEKNTLVYKFSEADLELFKSGQGRQDKKPREAKTGHKQKTSRVNKLNRGQTRQDREDTRGDNDRTDKLLDMLDRELTEKSNQITEMQKHINELTATVKQNSKTLEAYSGMLLALQAGKTGQKVEDGHEVVETKEEETDQTPEAVTEVDTDKTPIEEVIEDQTEGTEETQKEVEETAKTGQEGTKKKKHFWDFLFEER